jgi:catalase
MSEDRTRMTTYAGRPGGDNQNSSWWVRAAPSRIPEHVVHAKGSGAHGYFIAPMPTCRLVRPRSCSPRSESGRRRSCASRPWAATRAPRTPNAIRAGFALKFYTEEGNWGMVGNNTPVFFIRDGLKFGDFILTQKGDPETT